MNYSLNRSARYHGRFTVEIQCLSKYSSFNIYALVSETILQDNANADVPEPVHFFITAPQYKWVSGLYNALSSSSLLDRASLKYFLRLEIKQLVQKPNSALVVSRHAHNINSIVTSSRSQSFWKMMGSAYLGLALFRSKIASQSHTTLPSQSDFPVCRILI